MSLNRIESFLFHGQNITHGVVDLVLTDQTLKLTTAPWPDLQPETVAIFCNTVITSKEILEENEEADFPWDIIGFDSYDLCKDRYRFVLYCDVIEIIFEADWPQITS